MQVSEFHTLYGPLFDKQFWAFADKFPGMAELWEECGLDELVKMLAILGCKNYQTALIQFCSWCLSNNAKLIDSRASPKATTYSLSTARLLTMYAAGHVCENDFVESIPKSKLAYEGARNRRYATQNDLSLLEGAWRTMQLTAKGRYLDAVAACAAESLCVWQAHLQWKPSVIKKKLGDELRVMIGNPFTQEDSKV